MQRLISTVSAWLIAMGELGALGALTMVSTDADAQNRAARPRSQAPAVRSQAPRVHSPTSRVRPHGSGVHTRPGIRHPRVGVVIGAPYYASPWWGYPSPYPHYYGYDPFYHPPTVYVREEPMVYIEQQPPASASQPEPYWYYCEDSKTYYPHVQTCATPWQRVIPHAPQ